MQTSAYIRINYRISYIISLLAVAFSLTGAVPALAGLDVGAQDTSEVYLLASPGVRLSSEKFAKNANGQFVQDRHFDEGGFKPWIAGLNQDLGQIGSNGRYGLDVCYLQEGHIRNNHRDGFCAMGYYKWSTDDQGIKLIIGAGPYAGFNSHYDGLQRDIKQIGIAASLGLEKELSAKLGVRVRVEFVRTDISKSFDGTFMLAGISKSFGLHRSADGEVAYNSDEPVASKAFDHAWDSRFGRWSVGAGLTQINVPGHNVSQRSVEIERTHSLIDNHPGPIYSILFRHEGDTDLTNRNGVAALIGYEARDRSGWVVGGEVGPEIEHDSREQQTRLNGLSRIYAGKYISNILVSFVFERVAEFSRQARDADTFLIDVAVDVN